MSKKTIIVFSGDYDKWIAAFIIANGAAAMDDDVTMFFTFWGLPCLRKPGGVSDKNVVKTGLQKMFAGMLPKTRENAWISKFNFCGLGRVMMKMVMKSKNVMTVSELMQTAREQGVKLIACTMSMDILGISEDQLIDDIEYAGVATYLGEADEANVNLFI